LHNRFAIAPKKRTTKQKNCFVKRTNTFFENGAGNEARTRDLNLGKVALYQLSYSRMCSLGLYIAKTIKAQRNKTEKQ